VRKRETYRQQWEEADLKFQPSGRGGLFSIEVNKAVLLARRYLHVFDVSVWRERLPVHRKRVEEGESIVSVLVDGADANDGSL
jgi:hypothetical protein